MAKDTRDIKTLIWNTGMRLDVNKTLGNEQSVTHARNALLNTHLGDSQFYTNEPSNYKCVTLPYKFNGEISLKDNRYLVASSDNINSELGIVNLTTCTYTKLINQACLNFNNDYIITGGVTEDENGNELVIFNDGGYNVPRKLNIGNIPYSYIESQDNCKTKVYSDIVDCNELRLFPKISLPCITPNVSNIGSLKDGTYQFAIAYLLQGVKFTDVFSLTTPIFINNNHSGSSIELIIDNLDRDFKEYELIVIGTVNGITTPKIIGKYSTSQDTITISDFENPEYRIISNEYLTTQKVNYNKAGIISTNQQYTILADLERKQQINTQLLANEVELEWTVTQYPENYYKKDGEDIGYYRNENYAFILRYLWDDGEKTEHGRINGRSIKDSDKALVTGSDLYESTVESLCEPTDTKEFWQIYNTASAMKADVIGTNSECGRQIGYGDFGYYASTEKYPDNKEVFGKYACTNIILHQFPDECKVPRYFVDGTSGQRYINILGVRLKKAPPIPKDENGKVIKGIIGYELLRLERTTNDKRVISRGMLSNMGGHIENNNNYLYSNFPYNDLSPNQFLSSTKVTKKNSKENNFNPLSLFHRDKFAYYSPTNYYFTPYKQGREIIFETEESANVSGQFIDVYKHPKNKLLTNGALIFAASLGVIQALLVMSGKKCITREKGNFIVPTPTPPYFMISPLMVKEISEECDTAYNLAESNIDPTKNTISILEKVQRTAIRVLQTATKVASLVVIAAEYTNEILDTIRKLVPYKQYAYQYNSHGLFDSQRCILPGNKRRYAVKTPEYIFDNNRNIDNYIVNNFQKQKFSALFLNTNVNDPTVKDNTRKTIKGFGKCLSPTDTVTSTASMFYVTTQVNNPNQYGNIENNRVVKLHNCIFNLQEDPKTVFGGDCVIVKESVLTKQPLFSQNLGNTEFPDGQEYDYQLYRNIGYPRYWMDTTDYDVSNLLSILGTNPNVSKLPAQKHNLDCKGDEAKKNVFVIDGQYMYTHINGVIEYFVEVDYNSSYRERRQEDDFEIHQPHYGDDNRNINEIFRSDRIKKPEGFYLNESYKKILAREIYSQQITKLLKTPRREKNSLIYSQPYSNLTSYPGKQSFLPGNYFSFDEQEFGNLSGVHSLDQDKTIFLFSKASPYISIGRDQLETTDGRKITIGDGGLFAQQPRELIHTDIYYGSSHSKYAFKSTQFGHFYPSEVQGKIFSFTNNLNEVSRNGVKFWCEKYMPFYIQKDFPEYENINHPQTGIGYQISFDNLYELVYISKRDVCLRQEWKGKVTYNKEKDKFYHMSMEVSLQDSKYFEDASWTLSYAPTIVEGGGFCSFHDWHPDWVIQQENHFVTIKGNTLWKHNDQCSSYCNFYGKDYPYEIEHTLSTGQNTHLLNSVEYFNEVYINKNDCRDRFHTYEDTFDEVWVYNTEQHSGPLKLIYNDNNPYKEIKEGYPKINTPYIDILYSKKEQKYRFNMFTDRTKDRGQITTNETQAHITSCNGYVRTINPNYIDYNKDLKQQKRIRHYINSVFFRKNICNNLNFINKFDNFKLTISKI